MDPFLNNKKFHGTKLIYRPHPNGNDYNFIDVKKFKNVINKTSIKDAVHEADLVIIHTEWNDFKSINFKNLVKGKKFIIFDMRNIYSSTKIKEQGFKYYSIGK